MTSRGLESMRGNDKWTNNFCSNLCCHSGTNYFKEGALQHAPFILLSSVFAKRVNTAVAKKDFISKQWIVTNWKALHRTSIVLPGRWRAKFVIKRCRCNLFIGKINCIIHLVNLSFLPICMIQTEVTYFLQKLFILHMEYEHLLLKHRHPLFLPRAFKRAPHNKKWVNPHKPYLSEPSSHPASNSLPVPLTTPCAK